MYDSTSILYMCSPGNVIYKTVHTGLNTLGLLPGPQNVRQCKHSPHDLVWEAAHAVCHTSAAGRLGQTCQRMRQCVHKCIVRAHSYKQWHWSECHGYMHENICQSSSSYLQPTIHDYRWCKRNAPGRGWGLKNLQLVGIADNLYTILMWVPGCKSLFHLQLVLVVVLFMPVHLCKTEYR